MDVVFHKSFTKALNRRSTKVQNKFFERLDVFRNNPFDAVLRNHALSGKYRGQRSIDISGDTRAIYVVYEYQDDVAVFVDIGTHSELYG